MPAPKASGNTAPATRSARRIRNETFGPPSIRPFYPAAHQWSTAKLALEFLREAADCNETPDPEYCGETSYPTAVLRAQPRWRPHASMPEAAFAVEIKERRAMHEKGP